MSEPTPIGYLVPEFPSQTHAFFWREVLAMEEAGAVVCLFSTRRPSKDACPHDFAAEASARTTYLFPPDTATLAWLARRPLRAARAVGYVLRLSETPWLRRLRLLGLLPAAAGLARIAGARGVEHVHIHSCANAAHLGALAHILSGLDYSLTLHGDLPVYGTDHAAKMKRARFVSAVTAPLARSLREKINHDQPYPVIWMGVDTGRFCPAPDSRPADAAFRIVSVARLNYMKGHRFVLRSMARLRDMGIDVHYQIAGEGPERRAIETEIAELDLAGRVELLGSVSEARVLSLLQGADALLLTSIRQGEAAPVAVMEAMSCGVPPIVSIIGGTPDMITDGHDGILVAQEDVSAITKAIQELATDHARRAAMGNAARATAEAKFDHRRNALALHEKILTAAR